MSSPGSSPPAPGSSTQVSPLSPLKRGPSGTALLADNDVEKASKRLREVLGRDEEKREEEDDGGDTEKEDEEGESGKGKGKGKVEDEAKDGGEALSTKLESQVTCGICQALADMYLSIPSNAQEGRSKEERDALDEVYKGGPIPVGRADGGDDEEEVDFEFEGEEDDEFGDGYDDEDDEVAFLPQEYHRPCTRCDPDSGYDFLCPVPIPDPDLPENEATRIPENHFPRGHIECAQCRSLSPKVNDPEEQLRFGETCTVCHAFACSHVFRAGVQDCRALLRLKKLRDTEIPDNPLATLFPALFSGQRHEQTVLQNFLQARNWSPTDLFNKMFLGENVEAELPTWLSRADGSQVVELDDVVCGKCAVGIFEHALEKGWKDMMKQDWAKDFIAANIVNRQACWYGQTCRTSFHNPAHASRLSHFGPNTRDNAPPPPPAPAAGGHRILPSAIPITLDEPFRDINHTQIFLATGTFGNDRVPGKLIAQPRVPIGNLPKTYSLSAPVGEQEQWNWHNQLVMNGEALMVTDEMKWVPIVGEAGGEALEGEKPVEGGMENGVMRYHSRAWLRGTRVPGKAGEEIAGAMVSFGGKAWLVEEHEVLCWK
ncbi:hypothetical protein MNV49_004824 [Pseudohyphozyma bogoriensis]|nr:hypothetical protein MNV49_004824 [Pseudohyphozyma bogoriensis]